MTPTAAGSGLLACHSCRLLSRRRPPPKHGRLLCPRCGATLHQRLPNSIQRTWALLIAAAILYVPANLLPMMPVQSLGKGEPHTILSGLMELIGAQMWPIALVIFIASILVPILKLSVLCYLLISVQRHSQQRLRDRTRLYRITEAIGRWSMVDIYVVAILVALVKLGKVADIQAGPAGIPFAGVVILTMLAAMSFDSRLIWDHGTNNRANSRTGNRPR